jgi:hypothetical protein
MNDDYKMGYGDALADVKITSAKYAALEKGRDDLKKALGWLFERSHYRIEEGRIVEDLYAPLGESAPVEIPEDIARTLMVLEQ